MTNVSQIYKSQESKVRLTRGVRKVSVFLIHLIVTLVPKLDYTYAISIILFLKDMDFECVNFSFFFSFLFLYPSSFIFHLSTQNSGSHNLQTFRRYPQII